MKGENQCLLWELLGVFWPTCRYADLQSWAGDPRCVQFYVLDTAAYLELVLVLGWLSIHFLLGSKALTSVDSLALLSKQVFFICALFLLLFRRITAEVFLLLVPIPEYCWCWKVERKLSLDFASLIWFQASEYAAISQITNICYTVLSVISSISWIEEIAIWGGYCILWFLSCFCRRVTHLTWVEMFLTYIMEKERLREGK